MATRKRKANPAESELVAPVTYRAEACRMADASWLPMTVYRVVDGDGCAWFQVGNIYYPESKSAIGMHIAPLVTFLPSRYFNACQ